MGKMRELADRLFGLFESGDFSRAVQLFDRDAIVKQYFGPGNGRPIPIEEFERSISALVAMVGAPRYLNRRVIELEGGGGFVEQHTSKLNGPKGTVDIEVCVVVRTNASGKIVSLEEYLDPAPLSRRSKKRTNAKTASRPRARDKLGSDTCCVVVGATSGIGEEIAMWYARRGCAVVLAGRRKELLESVAKRCRSLHPSCRTLPVRTDVTVSEDCTRLIAEAVSAFGPPARLVLNAGISQNAALVDSGSSLVRQQLATNFFGSVELACAALPHMLRYASTVSSLTPRIVVVSSALGLLSAPRNTGYVASKAALNGFFESLRCEVGDKISISIVAPGPVDTPILRSLSGPHGTKVALKLTPSARTSLMSAEKAAQLTTEACESGTPLLVFPPLDRLVALKYSGEKGAAKVQRLMTSTYKNMRTVPVPSRL